jgi:hypothetical protein
MTTLAPISFYDDVLWADAIDPAHPVAVKPICDALQIAWNGQFERIKRDAILGEGIRVIRIPSPGGLQETVCLPLALIPGFLFGIDDRRIKDEAIRAKVLRYKRECHAALYVHFLGLPPAGREAMNGEDGASPPALLPGHPDFSEAVSLVREARLSMGKTAALAIWRAIGLPWVAEFDQPATLEADTDADPVAIFAREAIECAPGVIMPNAALYPAFADFCRRRGLHAAGANSFLIRFARMGFSRTKTRGVRVYRNIRIKAEQEETV